MDVEIFKKKISSYRTEKGRLTKVPDDLALEMLHHWENWTGTATGFYSAIGCDFRKVAGILGRAKKLRREGHVSEFTEVKVEQKPTEAPVRGINVRWEKNKVIQFPTVDTLVEFLQKVA